MSASSKRPKPGEPFDAFVERKRAARMARVDAFDPATRSLIHEYGLAVVTALRDVGVSNPKHIHHVVETILNEFIPTRGSYSHQGVRTQLDEVRRP